MKKLRVLLVDDEIMIREGFKRLFDWEAHDCEVVGEAADGMEALAKIDSLKPDIAIMDINIPIMNGLKVIQMARLKHPDMAFVIVSGYDDFSYCREALRLQITDYILKPVNYEEFGTCIDNLKIALFQRQSSKQETQQEERPIHGITRYLQEHLTEEISLSVLAEEFHLNPHYISQLFNKVCFRCFFGYRICDWLANTIDSCILADCLRKFRHFFYKLLHLHSFSKIFSNFLFFAFYHFFFPTIVPFEYILVQNVCFFKGTYCFFSTTQIQIFLVLFLPQTPLLQVLIPKLHSSLPALCPVE